MTYVASTSLARQLGALFEDGSAAGLSDRQLLERFATRRDEAAFAALVARHGPMVLGVCRQLLGDRQHAEDAFQAVFLVLARKAPSLREPELLGNWLYGVALRTARRGPRHGSTAVAGPRKRGPSDRPEARPAVQAEQMIEREQAEALHREIDRLPGSFRSAVVLCYFEGLSPDEAARRLRWPSGTLRSRLVRASEKLRRGLACAAASRCPPLAPRSAPASVSSLLCDSTTRAAIALRGPSRRRRRSALGVRRGTGPGGPADHADPQAQARPRCPSLLIASLATGAGFLSGSLAMKEEPVKEPSPRRHGPRARQAGSAPPAGEARYPRPRPG